MSTNFASLPIPDDASLKRSEALQRKIIQCIKAQGGYIDFASFMDLVLYSPSLGYYESGSKIFGPAGDFITAPECTALFSKCLAYQCAQISADPCGKLLELGAGSGIMAADILLQLEKLDSLPSCYFIYEPSKLLRARQQRLLRKHVSQFYHLVEWVTNLSDVEDVDFILANEVIDALPARRFMFTEGALYECVVAYVEDSLKWSLVKLSLPAQEEIYGALCLADYNLPDGYLFEYHPQLQSWLTKIYESLSVTGTVLFIDYGYPAKEYYHPQRGQGSLLCYYRHHAHTDPFFFPGCQDLTISVDFSRLVRIAYEIGFSLSGYTNQTSFLLATGIEKWLIQEKGAMRIAESQQVQTLLLPDQMGERFKVMALSRGKAQDLLGFSIMDQRFWL